MKKAALLALAGLAQSLHVQAADIVWVSFHPGDNQPSAGAAGAGFTQAPDVGYTQLLEGQGHHVTRVVTASTPNIGLLNSADLVIISRSVPSGDYQDDPETAAWASVTAPVMLMGGYIIRNSRLGFTTGATIPDTVGTVTLKIEDPSHPIFAGIPKDANNVMATPFANPLSFNGVVQRGISVNTDPVAGGGKLLATIATAGDPALGGLVIGEWKAGSVLATSPADTLAGPRMVFLSGSREQGISSEAAGIYDLSPDGSQLFLNAVDYMVAIPEPGTGSLLTVGLLTGWWIRSRRR